MTRGGKKQHKQKLSSVKIIAVVLLTLFFAALIVSIAPSWGTSSTVNYTIPENITYLHNLTQNITGYANDVTFAFIVNSQFNLSWQNASGTFNVTTSQISDWVSLNGSNGILNFSAQYDNQTGFFIFPIQAKNTTDDEATTTKFEFIINATNDLPSFTDIQSNYSFNSSGGDPAYNITVYDEDNHSPFLFEINFTSCTHASWLGIPDNTNCSLFNITNFTGTTARLNYTPSNADVGSYNATINVTEAVHTCPHEFCDNTTYELRHSIQYNITVNVLASMEINVSSCYRQEFTEGVAANCSISIRTRGATDTFNLTSIAAFSSYSGSPTNTSWFYPTTQHTATNNLVELNISVNGSKSLVGNWTLNLSTSITGSSIDYNWTLLPIFINWTGNSNLSMSNFDTNYSTSASLDYTIEFNVTDPDFEIEDKDFYNETPIMNITVINLSSGLEVYDFFTFSIGSPNGNVTPVNVTFSTNESHDGVYNVTINATDQSGVMVFDYFNITILANNFPYWNATSYLYNLTVNTTQATSIENITSLNLSRNHANDSDITDTLTFTNNSAGPPSLTLSSSGILNFIPWKQDVGYWNMSITVSDQLSLTNTSYWIFNISNENSAPFIDESLSDFNGTSFSPGYNFTANVSDATQITLQLYDNDLFISDSQITNNGAYNESLTVTTTITNTSFMPSPLSFSFSFNTELNNNSVYTASFTPNVSNIGNYTVLINVTDESNASDTVTINLTIGGQNAAPTIENITTQETSYLVENFSFTIIANDSEDDAFGRELNYTLTPTNSGPNLNIGLTNGSVTFNFSANESYVGNWTYNVSVNDSSGNTTVAQFNVLVHGYIDVAVPLSSAIFTGDELENTTFNIDINDSINGSNLTYYLYFDMITYFNQSNVTGYNYSNVTFRTSDTFIYDSGSNLTFNYTFNASDETYGQLKNMTFVVFRNGFESFNKTLNYKVNVTHTNHRLHSIQNFSSAAGTVGTGVQFDLYEYFSDVDTSDSFYNQEVNFSINQSDETNITVNLTRGTNFNVTLDSASAGTFNISIIGLEINSTDDSGIRNVTSDWFTLTLVDPETETQQSSSSGGSGGGGGTRTILEYFSIKIITPNDIEISPDNFVEVNFSVFNNGNLELSGIDLSSLVELDGEVTSDLSVGLSETYIESLGIGEQKNFSLRVAANTEAVGEYRIVIFGNVSSPSFSDWGEFYVRVQSLDESQLSQLLIFTEKFISENPECLELSEVFDSGEEAFNQGNFAEAERILNEVIRACEDAILANEQISFFDRRVRISFMYSLIISSILFGAGIIYYFYRRIKFKKLINREYI